MKHLLLIMLALGLSVTACSKKSSSAAAPAPVTDDDDDYYQDGDTDLLLSGQVSITLKKKITTQQEVVETFGAPNLVTQNSDGEESWTYQKQATVSNASSSSAFATIILAGASSSSSGLEQSSRTITLIIKFRDIKGVKTVTDFSSRYSSF